jgi:hypothetical protein
MSYQGLVCLTLCSLIAVLLATILPWIEETPSQRKPGPQLPWLVVLATVALVSGVLGLRSRTEVVSADIVTRAVLLAGLTLAGAFAKWGIELFARKPSALHALTLARSLLLAPAAPLCATSIFTDRWTPSVALLWAANGFIMHTLVGDLERAREKERVIVRRIEPPYPGAPGAAPATNPRDSSR